MGMFDAIASIFSTRRTKVITIGEPLTADTAKRAVSRLILGQPLERLRPTAEAVAELEPKAPMTLTVSMDHYCNGPRLVRFQNAGGKQLDVDVVSRIHGRPGVLQDEVRIQHLLGDIEDRRGHLNTEDVGHLDITPLAKATAAVLAPTAPQAGAEGEGILRPDRQDGEIGERTCRARRDWLYALIDQLPDAVEVTGGHIAALLDAVCVGCEVFRDVLDADDAQAMRTAIVRLLGDDLDPAWRDAVLNPSGATTAYMTAIDIMRAHGLDVQPTVELV